MLAFVSKDARCPRRRAAAVGTVERRPSRGWRSIGLALLLSMCSLDHGIAAEGSLGRFVRLRRDEDRAVSHLETAVVRYARETSREDPPLRVDLVGAIHIADRDYYDLLNKRFATYDVVLYELVAESDVRPQPGQRSAHPLSMMQVMMKNLLDLEFQLDGIDYAAQNFVHADLSPDEFAESMSQRGESLAKMFFRLMGQGIAVQSKSPTESSDMRLAWAALFSPNRSLDLKRAMAEQFEATLAVPSVLDGPDGSTIITVRNGRAVEVLAEQVSAGQRRIAIFYGAAHLPDMEAQLKERFELLPQETEWLPAWSMAPPAR